MSALENPDNEAKVFAMQIGVVIDRNDPKKLGRIKVRIPGLTSESAWAFPVGNAGGGGGVPRRGMKWIPKLGAEVCIWFHLGDLDHPYYMPGNWGIPDEMEIPGGGVEPETGHFVSDDINADSGEELSPEEAVDIIDAETSDFHVSIDERSGKRKLQIRNKLTGDHIEYDCESSSWIMRATTAVDIQCLGVVNIEGNQIQLNGRIVRNSTDPV